MHIETSKQLNPDETERLSKIERLSTEKSALSAVQSAALQNVSYAHLSADDSSAYDERFLRIVDILTELAELQGE